MPKSVIEKQALNKYDNKQRKLKEQKTERLSLRISKTTKADFMNLQEKTGLSQSALLDCLINNNHISVIQNGSLMAKELAVASQQLNIANMCFLQGNNGLVNEQIQQTNNTLNNIQKLFLQALGGITNGNL